VAFAKLNADAQEHDRGVAPMQFDQSQPSLKVREDRNTRLCVEWCLTPRPGAAVVQVTKPRCMNIPAEVVVAVVVVVGGGGGGGGGDGDGGGGQFAQECAALSVCEVVYTARQCRRVCNEHASAT